MGTAGTRHPLSRRGLVAAAVVLLAACGKRDESLALPQDYQSSLQSLRREPKFRGDAHTLYGGVLDEADRVRAEEVLNSLIDRISEGVAAHPTKSFILGEFSKALPLFGLSDTEDRERACFYLAEIMACVGLKSSDGLLNKWLYGFDPKAPKR